MLLHPAATSLPLLPQPRPFLSSGGMGPPPPPPGRSHAPPPPVAHLLVASPDLSFLYAGGTSRAGRSLADRRWPSPARSDSRRASYTLPEHRSGAGGGGPRQLEEGGGGLGMSAVGARWRSSMRGPRRSPWSAVNSTARSIHGGHGWIHMEAVAACCCFLGSFAVDYLATDGDNHAVHLALFS